MVCHLGARLAVSCFCNRIEIADHFPLSCFWIDTNQAGERLSRIAHSHRTQRFL